MVQRIALANTPSPTRRQRMTRPPVGRPLVCLANAFWQGGRLLVHAPGDAESPTDLLCLESGDPFSPGLMGHERRYVDGRDPRPGDLLEYREAGKRCVTARQSIDSDDGPLATQAGSADVVAHPCGRLPWSCLTRLAVTHGTLWEDGSHSRVGLNDRVHSRFCRSQGAEARLIDVDHAHLVCQMFPGGAHRRLMRRIQMCFDWNGVEYRLWVKDPILVGQCADISGVVVLGRCLVTVVLALGVGWHWGFKLVCAVLPEPSGGADGGLANSDLLARAIAPGAGHLEAQSSD